MRDRSRARRLPRLVLALAGGLALSLAVFLLTAGTSGTGQLPAKISAAMRSLGGEAGLGPTALLTNVNRSTGLGTVIGVIGGYEQGGYTSDVSYAARFCARTAALYKVANSNS